MEIRRWQYYIVFNCVVLNYLEAKTISLNDVITAESQRKETFQTTLPPRSSASSSKRYSLIQRLRSSPLRIKNFLESGFLRDYTPLGGNLLSPLKYRKTYLIKSPLKPRKLKLIQKSRFKRKDQSTKREIHGNEELKQKYIPLLKSLSMLFDNLLNTDSSESYEVKTKKYKRHRYYFEDTFEDPGNTHQSDSRIAESESQEETATIPPTVTTTSSITTETPTTTEVTTTTANIVATSDVSALRQHKNIPVLLPRNTISGRGDDHGIGEGSSATLHGDIEGNITRYHGDHEHDTGCGEKSCSEDDEENTDGVTRDGAGGFRLTRPIRTRTRLLPRGNSTDSEIKSQNETINDNETPNDHNRENQFQTGRNKTESRRILQESLRRLRGFISKGVIESAESVQSKEVREESVVNVTHDIASYQRITDGGSSAAKEDQKVRTGHETMTTINNLNFTTSQSNAPKKNSPVMMIYDGYSIVKHKNGQNKFAEKSIHIHS